MTPIYGGRIFDERAKESPNGSLLLDLRAKRSKLCKERVGHLVSDHCDVVRIGKPHGLADRARP